MALEAAVNGDGNAINILATADIAAGEIVVVGVALLGVASYPILDTKVGAVELEGEFDVAKDDSTAFAVGVKVYFDASANEVTETALGGIAFGIVTEAAVDTATTVMCKKVNFGEVEGT